VDLSSRPAKRLTRSRVWSTIEHLCGRVGMVMAVAAPGALFGLPGVASAADVTVTTADDHSDQTGCTPADCTLREAVAGRATHDVMHVTARAYTLTLRAHTLTNGTLQGAGAGSTVIRRSASAGESRVITIGNGATATISGVTITGGLLSTGLGGGGVYVPASGTLTIVNSAIVG